MTLQEMINSLDNLSQEDMTALLEILRFKLSDMESHQIEQNRDENDTFWDMAIRFRKRMEKEEVELTDEDFTNLRDRSVGREIRL